MSVLYDCHIHSDFSKDAKDSLEDMVVSAMAKGMKKICFTEHQDFYYPYLPGEEGMFELNTDSYLYELLTMREKYDRLIGIGFGVELGLQLDCVKENYAFSNSQMFDYIIGSLHIVDKVDPYYPDYFKDKSEEEAYGRYFELMYENIKKFSNFDVLGHLDYIVRYGENKDANYKYEIYKDNIDKILSHLVENGKGLEINTAGLRKGTKSVHPTIEIIKKYKELGGEIITVGSDAHCIKDIGADFDAAYEALKECGFNYCCTFNKRDVNFEKID